MSRVSLASRLADTIQTERLILRAPEVNDAPALQQLANNKTIHKFLARLPHPYSREHALDFINNLARTSDEQAYAIINGSGQFIGVMGLHLAEAQFPELGYWLGQPYWGQGFATEAALGVLNAATEAGHTTVFARSITQNKGSIAVLLKAGFIQTGEGIDDCGQHKGVSVTRFLWKQRT